MSVAEQDNQASLAKKRKLIEFEILDESIVQTVDTNAASRDKDFAPGAIFAAARANANVKNSTEEPVATNSKVIVATSSSKSGADVSTKPKQHPLPGVICVPADQQSASAVPAGRGAALAGSSLLVSRRQRGNPLLRSIRSVPWEYADIEPDFVLSKTAYAMFLSIRYHCLHPDYLHQRLKVLGQREYDLRVLLLLVDTQEYGEAIRELNRICLMAGLTLIMAWSNEEAARYLESYKSLEHKPADSLMERHADDLPGQLRDVLGCVRGVSRSDAACLAAAFGTFEAIVNASQAELERCPGLGPKKASRLKAVLSQNLN